MHQSPWGLMEATWSREAQLLALRWVKTAGAVDDRPAVPDTRRQREAARELERLLQRYFAGQAVDFGPIELDLSDRTPFQRAVYQQCREIGWGTTESYAGLAARCGRPKAARAVGQVMARNRLLLVIPCHRILATSGKLGGFSSPDGTQRKSALLALERRTVLD
jgi:methylated-DNA-[protein]-cysteine S-methyltransferase